MILLASLLRTNNGNVVRKLYGFTIIWYMIQNP